jgi:hypothetical protein
MVIVYRIFFFFFSCCLPTLLYGQSKYQTCHPVIRERNPCYLIPITKLNDTLIAIAGKYCTEFHFDSIENGTVKVYSDDTTTLLQIATIKRGNSVDSEYVFYENRQPRSLIDWKSGSYTSFHETGKAFRQGTIIKGDYGYLFTGTETTFWDNGNMATKSITNNNDIVETEYWNIKGDRISNEEFLDLWFKCK